MRLRVCGKVYRCCVGLRYWFAALASVACTICLCHCAAPIAKATAKFSLLHNRVGVGWLRCYCIGYGYTYVAAATARRSWRFGNLACTKRDGPHTHPTNSKGNPALAKRARRFRVSGPCRSLCARPQAVGAAALRAAVKPVWALIPGGCVRLVNTTLEVERVTGAPIHVEMG